MEFFTVQINQGRKTFKTLKLALEYISLYYPENSQIQIFHEEYPDYGHGFEDSHGYKTLVWPSPINQLNKF